MSLEQEVTQVYAVLAAGGVAVVPTAAGYGLLAMEAAGVERIYALKGRPSTKPCVTVAPWPVFDDVAAPLAEADRRWIAATTRWTPLAVVARLRPASRLIRATDPAVLAQCTRDGTIATFFEAGELVTRVALHAYARGRLVVGSSGNRSGAGNAYTLDEVPARFEADHVVDCGRIPMPGGERLATTMLDLETGRFLREGLHFGRIAASWAAHRGEEEAVAAK